MSDWISVRNEMPEDSKLVLFAVSDNRGEEIITDIAVGWYDYGYDRWVYLDNVRNQGSAVDEFDAVTHWMPLPDFPKDITLDDCLELCEWYRNGEKEANSPGVFLKRPEMIKMCDDVTGISINEIIKELPPEVGRAFKEVVDILQEKPDRIERCKEYGEILDEFDEEFHSEGLFPWLRHTDWRSGKYNFVFLKGYSREAIEELDELCFSWEREDGGCGSGSIFHELLSTTLENGERLYALDVCDFIYLVDDKIYIKAWDDDYPGNSQEMEDKNGST